MDRQSRHLIAAFAGLCACVTAALAQPAIQPAFDLREASWIAPGHRLEALSTEPVVDREALFNAALKADLEGLAARPDDLRSELLTGEFLFKAPLLLGGQAAKAGLSCHACHTNGRGNPHFHFAAISGEPGTADTTHSFFSKSLGNQVFDPVAIPDLTQPGKVDHTPKSGALEAFITTIVVEEFASSVDTRAVIGPLAIYVRALRLVGGDSDGPRETRSLQRDLDNVTLTAQQVAARLAKGERRTASLLLSSAQGQLQAIYERMIPVEHDSQMRWIVERSREAGAMRQALDADANLSQGTLTAWLEAVKDDGSLIDVAPQTLYNPALLARAMGQ